MLKSETKLITEISGTGTNLFDAEEGIAEKMGVVVRKYGLLAPTDWDDDITDELRRANRFWNKLVEIERDNRAKYQSILNRSTALCQIASQIAGLEAERETVIQERNRRRAAARSKAKADTAEQDARLTELRDLLRPLYAERKTLSASARTEMKSELEKLEAERRGEIKAARQSSGLFWSNYNAILDSFNVARTKALKDGAQLRFHRFEGEGRLVNQIQGGMTVEKLLGEGHSQAQLTITHTSRGRPAGFLRIKAFVSRDANNKPAPRFVTFPILMERPIPPGSIIKMVTVNIAQLGGKPRYSVTFTCRAKDNDEPDSGTGAAGINLGWKSIKEGLRVATTAFSNGDMEHLILPKTWIERMQHTQTLRGQQDDAVNELLPTLKSALDGMPLWQEGVALEGYPERLHRRLSGIIKAPRMSSQSLVNLLWEIKLQLESEPNTLPILHNIMAATAPADSLVADAHQSYRPEDAYLERWRKYVKRMYQEEANLRDRLLAQRKDMYRAFAKRIADRAGLVLVDATSYKEAAAVKKPAGEESELHAAARTNRVLAAPFELRLAIEQAMAKRRGRMEKYAKRINQCHACGATSTDGELIHTCSQCGGMFDVDENAARNLLQAAVAE
jgi:hypothetical protein